MLADDGQSLYVVFMGTKHMRDLLADANLFQEAVWKSEHPDKQQVISISLFLADLLCKRTYMHAATLTFLTSQAVIACVALACSAHKRPAGCPTNAT